MSVKLVEDWKDAWRWISVNCMILAAALQACWNDIPEDLKNSLPEGTVKYLTIGLLIFGVVGRLVHQETKSVK